MAPLIELYNCSHQQLLEWLCRTYGIVIEQNLAGTLQAPASNSAYAKTNVASMNPHRLRREDIARRLRLYRDDALVDVYQLIDQVYSTAEYQTELKKYVKLALGQNVTRRIIDEIASLYDQPAKRKLKDDKEQDDFRADEKRLHMHELLQENQRILTLCNETLIWRYQSVDNWRLKIIPPSLFDAIPDPRDELVEAGFLIDCAPVTIKQGDPKNKLPHWELWDDTYIYYINYYGRLVDSQGNDVSEPVAHGMGRIPGALLHRREPTTKILDSSHGSDIESTHLAVMLINALIMRLAKVQGENQPVIQGNLSQLTMGQVMNGEKPMMLPPETKATMLTMRTEPDHYIKAKRDAIAGLAQTYGMSYEQFAIEETTRETSGKSYEVRRIKLTEIRSEAKRRAHLNEALIVDLMGYDPKGMKVDHREPSLPQDAIEEIALLSDMMQLGLDSPITYMQRKDTDLHREDALDLILQNIQDRAALVVMLRALNMPSDPMQTGQSPQMNGKKGQAVMDNTNGGSWPAQGQQVNLRVKSDQAQQIIQTGLSADSPVDGYMAEERPLQTAGPNNHL